MPPVKSTWRTTTAISALTVATVGGIVALGGAGAASGSSQTGAGLVQAGAAQLPSVKSAFTGAIKAARTSQAPPASAVGDVSTLKAGQAAPMAGSSVRRRQLSDKLSTLAKHFTPQQAKHEAVGLRNAVAGEADPTFRNLGSGASKVDFTRVGVSGSTATVQAKVTLWAKFQQQIDGKWVTANPVNVMNYTATLVRNAEGDWLVDSLTGNFAPNEGP
ncbi:hypothetical protein ABZS86_13940 [Streptomyces sp. NPDC005355]|uniref:hypothetical protein n=1 Tax=Streptomyces sp. NPDC005355 TaxID=3157038 RepID=UPI0033A39E21